MMSHRKTYTEFQRALQDRGCRESTAVQYAGHVRSLMNNPRDPKTLPTNQETYGRAFQLFCQWMEGRLPRQLKQLPVSPTKNRIPSRQVVREMKRLWGV